MQSLRQQSRCGTNGDQTKTVSRSSIVVQGFLFFTSRFEKHIAPMKRQILSLLGSELTDIGRVINRNPQTTKAAGVGDG
jgi:hypothetical protein